MHLQNSLPAAGMLHVYCCDDVCLHHDSLLICAVAQHSFAAKSQIQSDVEEGWLFASKLEQAITVRS